MNFAWPSGTWPAGTWPAGTWPAAPSYPPGTGTVMSAANFPWRINFPSLYNGLESPAVDAACVFIESNWSGIFELFGNLSAAVAAQRQFNLEGLLVAWFLADLYPSAAENIQSDGGMPLSSKSIGGVSISRLQMEVQPGLRQLLTNTYGMQALNIILGRVERGAVISVTDTSDTGDDDDDEEL